MTGNTEGTNHTATMLLAGLEEVTEKMDACGAALSTADIITAALYLALNRMMANKRFSKERIIRDLKNAAVEVYDDLIEQGKDE